MGGGAPNFKYFCFTARATLTVSDWSRRLVSSSERIPFLRVFPPGQDVSEPMKLTAQNLERVGRRM